MLNVFEGFRARRAKGCWTCPYIEIENNMPRRKGATQILQFLHLLIGLPLKCQYTYTLWAKSYSNDSGSSIHDVFPLQTHSQLTPSPKHHGGDESQHSQLVGLPLRLVLAALAE